ncbi:MAG: hypothetical protein IKC22_00820 [Bacilli bacterium]|nr:hypothetical protein [Methanobrevibacter sp.]MBR2652855.1 hypothetical protein [bacterium]MBR2890925.1 hypothetical protein [Bacilli bacterium]
MINKDIEKIENNYDNLEILNAVKYLIGVVINDIEYMNDLTDEKENYDLGNNYIIKNEDLESLVSAMETLQDIINYN